MYYVLVKASGIDQGPFLCQQLFFSQTAPLATNQRLQRFAKKVLSENATANLNTNSVQQRLAKKLLAQLSNDIEGTIFNYEATALRAAEFPVNFAGTYKQENEKLTLKIEDLRGESNVSFGLSSGDTYVFATALFIAFKQHLLNHPNIQVIDLVIDRITNENIRQLLLFLGFHPVGRNALRLYIARILIINDNLH